MGRIFALLIGINQYQSEEIGNLQGCVRDAESMRDILLQYSEDAQICLLTDSSATKAGIFRAFKEHLLDNPLITKNDSIVMYFAGRGRRLTTPEGTSGRDLDLLLVTPDDYSDEGQLTAPESTNARDVDVLVPHDYSDDIRGIFDSTLHTLLCELTQKTEANVTAILDTSFSFYVPRGKVIHRSTWRAPPSHMLTAGEHDSPGYTGFFGDAVAPYVLLAACQQEELADETPDGGIFTRGLVSLLRDKQLESYRELAMALKFNRQHSFCSGLHADRPIFSTVPEGTRLPKLRVYLESPFITLGIEPENDFVEVQDKAHANVALRPASDGGITIERLDGLIAMYASRTVTVPAQDARPITGVLNKIAHFNYYFCLEPPRTPSPWNRIGLRPYDAKKPSLDLYSFKYSPGLLLKHINKSRNLFRRGVARVNCNPSDRVYAFKITTHSKEQFYPYVLCFNPDDYAIQTLYPSEGGKGGRPLKAHRFFRASSLTLGDGRHGGRPLTFPNDHTPKDKDAAFIKVIICTKRIDMKYILQNSAFASGSPAQMKNSNSVSHGPNMTTTIPGLWDTALGTMSIELSNPSKTSWKKVAQLVRVRGILRRAVPQ
ncbi:hypothetical protein FB451DRAFT_1553916 [Mycena latifolia]|nr:hypothetical protein FB451DRAFT_1553916 [Mycena latifolia]